MITEEQVQSVDICPINGNNGEIKTLSPDSTPRRSRFFRTKRQQRLGENQTDINEHSVVDVSSSDIKAHLEKFRLRSPSSSELTDENDECTPSIKDDNIRKQTSLRPSLSSSVPVYRRRKSQSVKLTHINQTDLCPKKVVRFADDFGLVLNQIRMITTDEFPCIPSTAFKHLQISTYENSYTAFSHQRMKVIDYMEPQFDQPIHTHGFNDRILEQKILLEQANAIDNRIYGTVRLFSCGLHKRVKIRVTTNSWVSFTDYDAIYIPNSYDGTYDRFSFTLEIDRHRICFGNNIQFCICYESFGGPEYWDNNYQENYRFDCCSRTIPDYCI